MGNYDLKGLFYGLVIFGFVIGMASGSLCTLAYQKFSIRIEAKK